MRRSIVLLFLTFLMLTGFAQQKPSVDIIKKRFNLSFSIYNDFWQNVPDSISPKKVNLGFDFTGLYNFPMDHKDKFNFFIGAGISSHVFKHNALIGEKKISDGVWDTYFYNVPAKVGTIAITHKVSKLAITYFEVPFGFRYNFPNKMHATLGFKVGWRINDHWKYKGDNFNASNSQFITGQQIQQKYANLLNMAGMHYGPYATIGYKWFGATLTYQVSSIYNPDRGPKLAPISVGLTFRPVR
jgi:hypothetical protein